MDTCGMPSKAVLEKAGRSPSGFLVKLNRAENRCPSPSPPPWRNPRPYRRREPPFRKRDILWREPRDGAMRGE